MRYLQKWSIYVGGLKMVNKRLSPYFTRRGVFKNDQFTRDRGVESNCLHIQCNRKLKYRTFFKTNRPLFENIGALLFKKSSKYWTFFENLIPVLKILWNFFYKYWTFLFNLWTFLTENVDFFKYQIFFKIADLFYKSWIFL